MRDFYNSIVVTRAESPVAALTNANTPFVSEVIDMQGYKSLVWVIQLGAITDADATGVVLIEESDTDFSGSAVADIDLNGTEALINFDFADDNLARKIGYHGSKRYVRMTITPADNNAGDIFLSATAIQEALIVPNAQAT